MKSAKTRTLKTERERRAIASPLRLELIGTFVTDDPQSVAEIAARMGRPPSAIHYHVRVLVQAGLLRRVGRRKAGKREEALYRPTARVFQIDRSESGGKGGSEAALRAMSSAFRAAEGDMRAALESDAVRTTGAQRNFFGARVHCRLSKDQLRELNRRLRAVETFLRTTRPGDEPRPGDSFVSLTVALMPLRNREVSS